MTYLFIKSKMVIVFFSENKAILTLKKMFLFIPFLRKALSVSVGEFFKKLSVTYPVGQWSCR